MAIIYPIHPTSVPVSEIEYEHRVVQQTHRLLKLFFGTVLIIAGADKFTNILTHWEQYLNPVMLRIVPLSPHGFMMGVGVVEIALGILVFLKPCIGGFLTMTWLIAIALQLIFWGQHLDVAVRDMVLAIGGALTLMRLSVFSEHGLG